MTGFTFPCVLGALVLGSPHWLVPTAVLVAVICVLIVWSYFRTPLLVASLLKLLAVIALAICLLEPLFSGTRPRPGANAFAVVVDNSESMNVRSDLTNQLRNALRSESDWQTRLAQDFDMRSYVFDRQVRNVDGFDDIAFDGTSSALASALDTVTTRLRKRPTAGLLLFSDGNGTDWESAPGLGNVAVPIFPVFQEADDSNADLRVTKLKVSQTNFEAAPTTVEVAVAAEGFPGRKIVAQLVDSAGEVVQEETQAAEEESAVRFRFRFRPEKAGLNFYQFRTFAESDRKAFAKGDVRTELTVRNNTRWVVVDRGGGPYRVLYVAGRPNWEFKFLRRALDGDEEIKLSGLLRIARKEPKFAFRDQSGLGDQNRLFDGFENPDEEDVEAYDQPVLVRLGIDKEEDLRDGFPKSTEDLFEYHAIIIDDLEAKFFSPDQMTLIRRFVTERGGGLLMAGGQESFAEGGYDKTPIGELLPVYLNRSDEFDSGIAAAREPLRWSLTREGLLQPWVRTRSTEAGEQQVTADMPEFRTVNRVSQVKPAAQVVAELNSTADTQRPALVTQRFGKGRTAALMIGDMWRWSLRREKTETDDLAQLWRQMTRWLVADVPRRVDVSLSPYVPGKPIQIEVKVRDREFKSLDNATVILNVITPEQKAMSVDAVATDRSGVYTADYWPQMDGCYSVEATALAEDGELIGTRTAGWAAEPAAAEFESLVPNYKRLDQLARESGGEVLNIDELDDFVRSLPNRKVPVVEPWVYPLWHHPFVFGFCVLCLCGEWGLRRWRGLP